MTTSKVEHVSIADARSRLDELIDRAAAGETIVIERGDGTAARLTPQVSPANVQKPYDWGEHWKWLETQPLDSRSPDEIDAELRSLDRY